MKQIYREKYNLGHRRKLKEEAHRKERGSKRVMCNAVVPETRRICDRFRRISTARRGGRGKKGISRV